MNYNQTVFVSLTIKADIATIQLQRDMFLALSAFLLRLKIINNNDNNNKISNFNNNIIPFFDYVCNERRKEVVACISVYQVKSVKLV